VVGCNNSDAAKKKKPVSAPASKKDTVDRSKQAQAVAPVPPPPPPILDTALYNKQLLHLAHDSASAKWPVKDMYPLPGALLPFNRIIAYYGNFYSVNMGILGELPPDEMLKKLMGEVKKMAGCGYDNSRNSRHTLYSSNCAGQAGQGRVSIFYACPLRR